MYTLRRYKKFEVVKNFDRYWQLSLKIAMSNSFVWERTYDHKQAIELLEIIEPHEKEREAIITCLENRICYRLYVAKDQKGFVVAVAIATFLPQTQTLHIEDFGLHPKIRGKGYAKQLWEDWRQLVRSEWTPVESLTIEVYMQNVEYWRKIMGVTELFPEPMKLLPLAPHIPMMFMGSKTVSEPYYVLSEWQQIQSDVSLFLKKNKLSKACL